MDNYLVGRSIKDMRGGHSNAQLEGMQEMAHCLIMFEDKTWDGKHVELTYDPKQDKPSHVHMVEYEEYTETSIAKFLFEHKDMPPATRPCMDGFRMFSYHDWMMDSKWIGILRHAFMEIYPEEEACFSDCPDNLNRHTLIEFLDLLEKDKVQAVFESAKRFQHDAVKKWNPNIDEAPLTNYMGLMAMNESVSHPTGALLLDIAAKSGLIQKDKNGLWEEGEFAGAKIGFIFGDVKTVDNIDKLVRDIANRPLSIINCHSFVI